MITRNLLIIVSLFILTSCNKDKPTPNDEPEDITFSLLKGNFITWDIGGQSFGEKIDIYLNDSLIGSPEVYDEFEICDNPSMIPFSIQENSIYNVKLYDNQTNTLLHEEVFTFTLQTDNDGHENYFFDYDVISGQGTVNFDVGWRDCNGDEVKEAFFEVLV